MCYIRISTKRDTSREEAKWTATIAIWIWAYTRTSLYLFATAAIDQKEERQASRAENKLFTLLLTTALAVELNQRQLATCYYT